MNKQTKTKPQETLEFKMKKQMQTFSFSHPLHLVEEGKWLQAVSSFECTNSNFNITNDNNSFSITMPGHWESKSDEKTIELNLNLRSENDIKLHVEAIGKRRNQIKIRDNDFLKLSDLDNLKDLIVKEWKRVKKGVLEDMVYRLRLTYDDIVDVLCLKHISTKRTGYSLNPGIYEVNEVNNNLKHILPNNVEVSVTIDDIRLKSNLKIIQTLIFTEKSFFYTILGFTRPQSYPLDDIDGFYQLVEGTYKSEKPINITGNDKFYLKCDCIQGRIVNGVREAILFSFAPDQPPGYKIYKEPRVKLFKKII